MLQIEIGIDQRLALGEHGIQDWCAQVRSDSPPFEGGHREARGAKKFTEPSRDDGDLARLVARLDTQGIGVWFIDPTRPEFGIPVVRAVAPGLCSDKPRWGWRGLTAPDPFDLQAVAPGLGQEPPNPRALWI